MKKVIIILGGGIEKDGRLPEIPRKRVEKGVQLFRETNALGLVMTGKYGFWLDWQKKVPPRSEASAMKEYAQSLGVSEENIFVEEDSKDTIGNAYFSKINILEPKKLTDIIVVTSDYHLPRTKFVFDLVFGPTYTIGYESAETGLPVELVNDLFKKEKKTLDVFKKILGEGIDAGDTDAMRSILFTKHPAYATNPEYSYEMLWEMLK